MTTWEVQEFYMLGYTLIDVDSLKKKNVQRIYNKGIRLLNKAKKEFNKWLKENNYNSDMGIIYKSEVK